MENKGLTLFLIFLIFLFCSTGLGPEHRKPAVSSPRSGATISSDEGSSLVGTELRDVAAAFRRPPLKKNIKKIFFELSRVIFLDFWPLDAGIASF